MFLALFLTQSAFAVCDFDDPVSVGSATQYLDVRADCYSLPGPGFEDGVSTDIWRLSLDSVDVQEIVEGTCSVEVDNGAATWLARARSSIAATHDKVYRRVIDATLRVGTVTVHGASEVVLAPADVACSGEETASTETVIFQVPETCPAGGGDATLADGTVEPCTTEQAASIVWSTRTTGSTAVPDITADNLRDMLILALMGSGEPDTCSVDPYPSIDIEFKREVYGMSSCSSEVGKIDGELWVTPPAAPVTVSLGASGVSCADASADLTLLDCEPTLSGP